jgi:hypothetical protein
MKPTQIASITNHKGHAVAAFTHRAEVLAADTRRFGAHLLEIGTVGYEIPVLVRQRF